MQLSRRLLKLGERAATRLRYSRSIRSSTSQTCAVVIPERNWQSVPLLLGAAALVTTAAVSQDTARLDAAPETTTLLNWSGTHAVHAKNFWEPETVEELEQLVKDCHSQGKSVRPLGSALSPNGIGFHAPGMVSLANLDEILEVDKENMTVTVQAGARVSQVVEALRPHGLTLPNLASIAEQQMGGFVQVGAHGTGAKISPVDHYVTKLRLISPGVGSMLLTSEHGDMFQVAKVGLGCLGVVAEVTMQCIPTHDLVEHTFVLTRKEAKEQLQDLLVNHKHMRFMWIPYTDSVVVVTNDPDEVVAEDVPRNRMEHTQDERFAPLRNLLVEVTKDTPAEMTMEALEGVGFGELRDALLAIDPLDVDHVKRVNEAEAEFWIKSQGYQTKPSDQLLQFDCGGQQWVKEVAFPTGKLQENNGNDIDFMEKLLKGIEEQEIPAHSPIEQRWSAPSSSLMSPAHGTDPDGLHSWVGIIMYLPSPDNELQRRSITDRFKGQYCKLVHTIGLEVDAASHWAKLELPTSMWDLLDLQNELSRRYPVQLFKKAREMLDPKDILGNPLLNLVFGGKVKNPDNCNPYDKGD